MIRPAALRTVLKRFPLHRQPWTHVSIGIGILLLDTVTDPRLMFPIVFVIPVFTAGWFCSLRLAYALALLLPLGRFLTHANFAAAPPILIFSAVNGLIEAAVLCLLAWLVGRTVRQAIEIKRLRGLLPICMHCKRIRDQQENWQRLETYITRHSEAQFTHGLCPECWEKHYGHLLKSKPSD